MKARQIAFSILVSASFLFSTGFTSQAEAAKPKKKTKITFVASAQKPVAKEPVKVVKRKSHEPVKVNTAKVEKKKTKVAKGKRPSAGKAKVAQLLGAKHGKKAGKTVKKQGAHKVKISFERPIAQN